MKYRNYYFDSFISNSSSYSHHKIIQLRSQLQQFIKILKFDGGVFGNVWEYICTLKSYIDIDIGHRRRRCCYIYSKNKLYYLKLIRFTKFISSELVMEFQIDDEIFFEFNVMFGLILPPMALLVLALTEEFGDWLF
ncbi:hypothetical protein DICPUDRAFT_81928 [Dictyostelium purpureum]|uniref:Uncharacterized protein n=1 Tax=Dictyostelium purpureum TaxID=5786 RepID=F0ZV05_DICPU|nr:uncharacterized protein DICPUDRAFT_81928 [Dictyostelium purpureum]EGC32210.1 hypothetical protein DICPUDRAFT_81928 [Dictyostelium purpureum]|eukprot:XP_003291246.1 hypothetical protein DICPUDRAFT_81928 [Dictyostelium purpureum]